MYSSFVRPNLSFLSAASATAEGGSRQSRLQEGGYERIHGDVGVRAHPLASTFAVSV